MSDNDNSNVTVSGAVPLYNHQTDVYVKASKAPFCVDYKVATDKDLKHCGNQGTVYASSDIDYTVKIEAQNLKLYTQYCEFQLLLIFRNDLTVATDYQFSICNSNKQAQLAEQRPHPARGTKSTRRLRFLCTYAAITYSGFFNAYGNLARKDSVDYVIHLDDHIYEYKNGDYGWVNSVGRIPLVDREIYTLYDYRKRLVTYKN